MYLYLSLQLRELSQLALRPDRTPKTFLSLISCHAPLPKIRGNGVAMRVGDVYTREKYPMYTR